MCQFKSAIVLRSGKILHSPATDSHEDLIDYYGLDDTSLIQKFVRIEFFPEGKFHTNYNEYTLKIDENACPAWFDEEMSARVRKEMIDYLESITIRGIRKILLDGYFILTDNAIVDKIINTHIIVMSGKSKVGKIRGNGSVGKIWDNGSVGEIRDNGSVGVILENGSVGEILGNGSVGIIRGNGSVGKIGDNGSACEIWNNGSVGVIRGNGSVGKIWDNGSVGEIRDNGKIISDLRNK